MQIPNIKIYLVIIFTLLISAFSLSNVFAVTYDISNNGAGSTNNVNVNQQNGTTTNQSNTSNINNNVNSNCNTGGNNASGNTGGNVGVNTGDCSTNINVTNKANTNKATINCPTCQSPKPSPKPSNPPVGGPGGGSSGGGSSSGGSSSSSGGPGETLGKTGTTENLAIFSAGMASIFAGLWVAKRQLVLAA